MYIEAYCLRDDVEVEWRNGLGSSIAGWVFSVDQFFFYFLFIYLFFFFGGGGCFSRY